MLHAWWNTNMDARRAISLLIAVAGCAVVALGFAASPIPTSGPFGSITVFAVPAGLGAAIGEYRRRRVSDPARAPLWGLASGAWVAASLVAMFGMAVLIRPAVRGIPGLEDSWSAILMSGLLVAFVGALLWERDARRRRFAALVVLAVALIVVGVFARSSGDPWASLGALVSFSGFGMLLLAFEVGRRSSRQDVAKPDTWR